MRENNPGAYRVMGLLALSLATACARDTGGRGFDGPGVEVVVTPLELAGVTDASFALTVLAGGEIVWQRAGITSKKYGNGRGDITYIGPCDASRSPNRVELILESLSSNGTPIDPGTWQNPTSNGPLVLMAECEENRDTSVVFNLTIMRDAQQGFFDIAVNFEDIFCSAKFDCMNDGLLFDPRTEKRSATYVMGFACAAGEDQETWLHLNDVYVLCDDGSHYYINPSGGIDQRTGNMGPQWPLFFETANYRGAEQLPGIDKCYWNLAFGVDLSGVTGRCHLEVVGTATHAPLDAENKTPKNTAYPMVRWSLDITDDNGERACSEHPLNGPDGAVFTDYTPLTGGRFDYTMSCGETNVTSPPRALCGGTIDGVNDAVAVTETVSGIYVSVGDARSELYVLPPDLGVGAGIPECCLSPCCTEPGGGP